MSDSGKEVYTLIDAALVFASIAAFEFGPVTAGVAASLATVMRAMIRESQISDSKQPCALVQQEIQDNEIGIWFETLHTYEVWYYQTYKLATKKNSEMVRLITNSKFYNYLAKAVSDPNAPLMQAMMKLQMDDRKNSGVNYRVKAFSTFLYGGAIHLMLYKLYLTLSSAKTEKIDKFETKVARNVIINYIHYAEYQLTYIKEQIQNRLKKVSEVKHGFQTTPNWAPEVHYTPQDTQGLFFTDSGIPEKGNALEKLLDGLPTNTVVFIPDDESGFIFKEYTQKWKDANQARASYIDKLEKEQKQNYNFQRGDDMARIIKDWKKFCNNLEIALQ